MAVDRSKFRTCQQTSFCRRHRLNRSYPAFDYRVLPQSIQLHTESDSENGAMSQQDNTNPTSKINYYQKIKRLLKGDDHKSIPNEMYNQHISDPYYRGPKPFLTASVINQSKHSYYPKKATNGDIEDERLELSLYLLKDGVARIRLTEQYGREDKPFHDPRWTSDDLILNMQEIIGEAGDRVQILSSEVLNELAKNKEFGFSGDLMAFEYGSLTEDGDQTAVVVLQMQPFAVHMWRSTHGDDTWTKQPPIASFNSRQMMHFEVRRNQFDDFDLDAETESEEEKKDQTDKHGGKEIVGYWEDGLAIYADGTREEKKENPDAQAVESEASNENEPTESPTKESDKFHIDEDGMWQEKFGDHVDSKPYGPMSVGGDISFPTSKHIYGLPEHASSMQLLTTVGEDAHYKEPYRLYNLDVFEYELDETMALYGEVPLIISQSKNTGTVGAFWFNPTETFVDIDRSGGIDGTDTHWISESGVIDLFLLPGPNPKIIYEQYGKLTGRVDLPPMFSLGYHQCRWNYRDEADVYQVHDKFEELDYPYDVLWLDIEHTDGKRYFTWDKNQFPNPVQMQEKLKSQGRNMVTIIDPHIKRDSNYYIHKEATEKGLYIKDKTGKKDYDGWCWPGSSSYLDFTNEMVRSWWSDQFAYNRYQGSTPSLMTWNDMNEPSVFNGPEVSMQKDLKNLDGVEHREWHNLYGILFQKATAEGLVRRNKDENIRPFVLSRSFFASSQKYGAIWTGDNESSWAHLKIAAPMLLSLNIGALSFVGADVGGFFGNPDAELMTRWMQAGAYQPFFRGHAHHDAKRREPWMFGESWMIKMRKAAMARYALLPLWYTLFREASISGMPVMRAMWMEYPDMEEIYHIDDQYLIGSDLLVKPITEAGATSTDVIFPTRDIWYDVDTSHKVQMSDASRNGHISTVHVQSDIDKIPVYQRGGSVIPRKLRLRRSTQMMTSDPYTLYIALDQEMKASGTLYMDDENTYDHIRKGAYAEAKFDIDFANSIECKTQGSSEWMSTLDTSTRSIERLIIMGVEKKPAKMSSGEMDLKFDFSPEQQLLIVKKPQLSALSSWKITIEY